MKRQRKTYDRPFKRWDKGRIAEEVRLMREYGLKNKREVWKAQSQVRKFRSIARELFTQETGREELFAKLKKLGIFKKDITLDDVLGLKIEDILERRLQTLVFRKGLASSPDQARQLIVHRHIALNGNIVTVPGRIVTIEEENNISYANGSPLNNPDHPIRKPPVKEEPKEKEKKEEKQEESKKEEKQDEKKKEEPAKKEVKEEKKGE